MIDTKVDMEHRFVVGENNYHVIFWNVEINMRMMNIVLTL